MTETTPTVPATIDRPGMYVIRIAFHDSKIIAANVYGDLRWRFEDSQEWHDLEVIITGYKIVSYLPPEEVTTA